MYKGGKLVPTSLDLYLALEYCDQGEEEGGDSVKGNCYHLQVEGWGMGERGGGGRGVRCGGMVCPWPWRTATKVKLRGGLTPPLPRNSTTSHTCHMRACLG
jgi:hypothetical protein